jgi:kynurenine formamidase
MARVEISLPVDVGGWHYEAHIPPLVRPSVTESATIAAHGFEAHTLTLPTVGACTYLETSGHVRPEGPRLKDFGAAELVFEVSLVRVLSCGPDAVIRRADLEQASAGRKLRGALLIDTGWGASRGDEGYVTRCPKYHSDTLPWFLAHDFDLLGVDVPAIEGEESRGKILKPLFERKGILLLAPLARLSELSFGAATLFAFPLAIERVSGAPCRALVIDGLDINTTR